MNINHVRNGLYEWQSNPQCTISWLHGNKVVEVKRGKVRVAGVNAEISVQDADKHGTFVRSLAPGEEIEADCALVA